MSNAAIGAVQEYTGRSRNRSRDKETVVSARRWDGGWGWGQLDRPKTAVRVYRFSRGTCAFDAAENVRCIEFVPRVFMFGW